MRASEFIVRQSAAVLALPAQIVRLMLWCYRVALSPFFGPCCRFVPSCSSYAGEALRRYGLVRGGWMAVRRLLRCHPLHPGGWDPVTKP